MIATARGPQCFSIALQGLHVGAAHVLPSQILVKLQRMTDDDDRRLRETVLAELKRRRHLAGENVDRPAENDADDADPLADLGTDK
jgi:hypothetical protein